MHSLIRSLTRLLSYSTHNYFCTYYETFAHFFYAVDVCVYVCVKFKLPNYFPFRFFSCMNAFVRE